MTYKTFLLTALLCGLLSISPTMAQEISSPTISYKNCSIT